MTAMLDEEDSSIYYSDQLREYMIMIRDGGDSGIVIQFCPFCGTRLPRSLSDDWYERLDSLGLEPDDPRLPADLQSGAWWRAEPERFS